MKNRCQTPESVSSEKLIFGCVVTMPLVSWFEEVINVTGDINATLEVFAGPQDLFTEISDFSNTLLKQNKC